MQEAAAAEEGAASKIGPSGVIGGPSVNVPEPLFKSSGTW
jgi:hypothetical protein